MCGPQLLAKWKSRERQLGSRVGREEVSLLVSRPYLPVKGREFTGRLPARWRGQVLHLSLSTLRLLWACQIGFGVCLSPIHVRKLI